MADQPIVTELKGLLDANKGEHMAAFDSIF